MEFIGRTDELETLKKWGNQNILIFGEPGIGKTRFISESLDQTKTPLFWAENMTLKNALTHLLEQCYASIGLETKTLHDLASSWTVSTNVPSMIVHRKTLSWAKLANGISRMDAMKKRKLLFKSLEGQDDILVIADARDFTPTTISFLIELMVYCQVIVSLPTKLTKQKKFQRLVQLFPLQLELNPLSISDSKILIEKFIKEKSIVFESPFDYRAATDYIIAKSEGVPKSLVDLLSLLSEKNLDFDRVYDIESDSGGIVVCLTPFLLLAGFIGMGYSRVIRYMGSNPEHVVWALILGLTFFGVGYLLRGK